MTASNSKYAEKMPNSAMPGSRLAPCRVCSRPSEEGICPACADSIRADALATTVGDAPKARRKPGRRVVK